MQTPIYILTITFHDLYHFGTFGLGHLRYQTYYKGFQKGSEEQNRNHTLQNGN